MRSRFLLTLSAAGLILFTLLTPNAWAESVHDDSEKVPSINYYEFDSDVKSVRGKALQARLKSKSQVDLDLVGEKGTTLNVASPYIERGAHVNEINITVITRDITMIAE